MKVQVHIVMKAFTSGDNDLGAPVLDFWHRNRLMGYSLHLVVGEDAVAPDGREVGDRSNVMQLR